MIPRTGLNVWRVEILACVWILTLECPVCSLVAISRILSQLILHMGANNSNPIIRHTIQTVAVTCLTQSCLIPGPVSFFS